MFIFFDENTDLRIRERAKMISDSDALRHFNEHAVTPNCFGFNGPVRMSDLTKKDREDIKYEIAARALGECIMHGPLDLDSLQNGMILRRAAKRAARKKDFWLYQRVGLAQFSV